MAVSNVQVGLVTVKMSVVRSDVWQAYLSIFGVVISPLRTDAAGSAF